jgi:hypothetical protein
MVKITKRNHYNPCLWTAYWNPDYFKAKLSNLKDCGDARNQPIYRLNIISDSIHPTIPDKVFFEKNQCFTPITPESAKKFCKKYHPSQYENFCQNMSTETYYLDFEDILTGMENIAYGPLLETIRIGGVSSIEHRTFLTYFLIIQAMRSHEMMTAMINRTTSIGMDKFEYFWLLKNAWGDEKILARALVPVAFSPWIFYRTKEDTFPMCDSPIMIGRNSIMAILSPKLLLEINVGTKVSSGEPIVLNEISKDKFREFQLRVLKNTYKDIIFHNRSALENLQRLPEYHHRLEIINDPIQREKLTDLAANRVLSAINGFNKSSSEFDLIISQYN